MQFRTEIETKALQMPQISHDDRIVMLGSCFTDSIGVLLERDGFCVSHNPMGPLYNPASLANAVTMALSKLDRERISFHNDSQGVWHSLDFASKYQNNDPEVLHSHVITELDVLGAKLKEASVVIITLGTAYAYSWAETGQIVGNCHKFPPQCFNRRRLSPMECRDSLLRLLRALPDNVRHVIFTVSPIRHTADTLHGNELSKASLLLAVDNMVTEASNYFGNTEVYYFPSYEIMIDDLRDYRFYAADMKHPSDVAIDYIYEIFSQACFSEHTRLRALEARKIALRNAHRQIL